MLPQHHAARHEPVMTARGHLPGSPVWGVPVPSPCGWGSVTSHVNPTWAVAIGTSFTHRRQGLGGWGNRAKVTVLSGGTGIHMQASGSWPLLCWATDPFQPELAPEPRPGPSWERVSPWPGVAHDSSRVGGQPTGSPDRNCEGQLVTGRPALAPRAKAPTVLTQPLEHSQLGVGRYLFIFCIKKNGLGHV